MVMLVRSILSICLWSLWGSISGRGPVWKGVIDIWSSVERILALDTPVIGWSKSLSRPLYTVSGNILSWMVRAGRCGSPLGACWEDRKVISKQFN